MNLILEFLKAGLGLGALLALWLGVQIAWRRAFPGHVPVDEDILAGRLGCHDCTCSTPCENRRRTETEHRKEG